MSDKQLVNMIYFPPIFDNDVMSNNRKNRDEGLFLLTKNGDLKESRIEFIPKPEIDFYITKDKDPKIELSKHISELNKITVRSLFRDYSIAKALNLQNEYINAKNNGNKLEFKYAYIVGNKRLFLGDIDLESFYKINFLNDNGIHYYKLRKSFLDIEVRVGDFEGQLDQYSGPLTQPVTLITYVISWIKKAYLFILYDRDDNQIKEVYENRNELVSWMKSESDFEMANDYDFIVNFYENEIDLFTEFWLIFNKAKADFCGIWNMKFDVNYMVNRMKVLGMDYLDHISHPDFGENYKYFNYEPGKLRKNQHWSRAFDWCHLTNYTQFYDMLGLYSNLRARSIQPSYKLDNVAFAELGIKKISLKKKYNCTIKNIEFINFKVFLKYGIKDTLLLDKLDDKIGDLSKFIIFGTYGSLKKCFNASIIIKNAIFYRLLQKDRIIGNNSVYDKTMYDDSKTIPGALVGDPNLINTKGIKIVGKRSMVFEYVADLDQKSQYPFVMIMWNIMKDTVYGRVCSFRKENGEKEQIDGSEFNQMLLSDQVSINYLAKKYLELPTLTDILKEI